MRIKDSPKSNAEGGNKKESKKKTPKQKTEKNATVTNNKNEKSPALPKGDKESQKRSPAKDEPEQQVSRANLRHTSLPISCSVFITLLVSISFWNIKSSVYHVTIL